MMHSLKKFLFWASRYSLGLAFVISGFRKLPGVKFTLLPIDNPVGLFFEGMYAAGFYWNFIGIYQISVGLLLFTTFLPRLTPLLSFPVTVNIFLISVGLQMTGTPFITFFMLLANLYLIIHNWEFYREIVVWKNRITIQA